MVEEHRGRNKWVGPGDVKETGGRLRQDDPGSRRPPSAFTPDTPTGLVHVVHDPHCALKLLYTVK
ncbi:hypothetical protein OUZ56_009389 [Daphnia magna]|uniref:Uncharacterized protein n=1 Tax=Daphnia magna TaxID=35525 RepID=A0ABR0AG91_9CRUS|nr:hypothetical protein OUZ56_009389 [Daphnia magna]